MHILLKLLDFIILFFCKIIFSRKDHRYILSVCAGGDGEGGRGGLAAPGRHIRGGQQEYPRGQGPQGETQPLFLDLKVLTNEKRGGLAMVSPFDRSRFKLISLISSYSLRTAGTSPWARSSRWHRFRLTFSWFDRGSKGKERTLKIANQAVYRTVFVEVNE